MPSLVDSLKSRVIQFALALLLLGSVYTLGLGVRRYVLQASLGERTGREVPFTLESALQHRRVKMIMDRGALPARDEMIQHPEGIDPARTYTVSVDYLQARLAGWLPSSMDLTARLRWIEAGWFCLAMPLLVLWGRRATGFWTAGIVAGFLYAVAISSVQRSTGAELSTENTSFPFLAAHLLCRAATRQTQNPRATFVWALGSAVSIALAVVAWDLMQFYLFAWAGCGAWNVLRGRWQRTSPSARLWQFETLALVLAGLLVPYQRAHGFVFSPALLCAIACSLWLLRQDRAVPSGWAAWRPFLLLGGVLAIGAVLSGYYSGSYGHFLGLLWAKIRFLNIKPDDPALLTFDQRLMWTPALHSPTFLLTIEMLLVMFAASLPAALVVGLHGRSKPDFDAQQVISTYVLSLLAYVFFFRFHVFIAFFGSLVCGLWWGLALRRGIARPALAFGWIALCIFGEFLHTLKGPWQSSFVPDEILKEVLDGRPAAALWGTREGVYHKEQIELTDWLEKHAKPEVVLSGFGISGAIAAYGKCGIVLHPKFETRQVRDKVRAYAEHLFTGSVKGFRDWADSQGARYYVYGLGSFSTNEPTLQLRYMANAMNPATNAPARMFEAVQDDGTYFRRVFSNRKFVVYDMLTVAEEVASEVALKRATEAFQRGDLGTAERESVKALEANPENQGAQKILQHVFSLRNKGFTGEHGPNL